MIVTLLVIHLMCFIIATVFTDHIYNFNDNFTSNWLIEYYLVYWVWNKNILFIADKFVYVFLPRGKIWIIVLFSVKMRQPVKNWFCLRSNLLLQR